MNDKPYLCRRRLKSFKSVFWAFTLLSALWTGFGGFAQEGEEDEAAGPIVLAAFGDSLSAGYQLPPGAAFFTQLEEALQARGHNVRVLNASVSGDTASAGLARLDWSLQDDVDGVILELGANDALRGIDPEITRQALDQIITRLKEHRIEVLLAGMLAPPNLGPDYGARFNQIYPDLAAKHNVLLYPFFLDGVAANPGLNLGDGIHPTQEGVVVIVERMLPSVEALLDKIAASS